MDHQAFAQLLGNYGEFVGAVAVVVTLGYLALQIRQNSSSLRATAEQQIASGLSGAMGLVASTEIPEIWTRAAQDPSQLNDAELAKFAFHLLSYLKQFEHAFVQRQMGNLSESSWEGVDHLLRNSVLTSVGVRRYWELRQNGFQSEFRAYVNSATPDSQAVSSFNLLTEVKR